MKRITGREAIDLIESAAAIIIMDKNEALTCPSIEQPDDEEFWNVDVSFTDDEGIGHEYGFKIWGDDEIEVRDNQLMLMESNSGYIPVKILEVKQL